MQATNRPARYSGTATARSSEGMVQAIAGAASASSPAKRGLTYQRGWSKARMKLARYSASGSTHRKGTLEMFCVMWLVTASSITEPMAESASQRIWIEAGGGAVAVSRAVCGSAPLHEAQAVAAQSNAKPANSNDHPQPSCGTSNAGSKSSGKPSSASSEAKFDSANSR